MTSPSQTACGNLSKPFKTLKPSSSLIKPCILVSTISLKSLKLLHKRTGAHLNPDSFINSKFSLSLDIVSAKELTPVS